jgi:hypothetical protein
MTATGIDCCETGHPTLFPLYSWSARASYQIVALPGRCYGFKYLVVIRICSLYGIDSCSPYR